MLSGLGDIALSVLFFVFFVYCLVLSMFVDSRSLDLFGSFVLLLVFPMVWIFSNLHMIHPEGSELDAALSIICKNDSFTNNNNCSAL